MAYVSDGFGQSLQANLLLDYLKLATQLFHQGVAMQHHASADLFSHTCRSAQHLVCLRTEQNSKIQKNAPDEATASGFSRYHQMHENIVHVMLSVHNGSA